MLQVVALADIQDPPLNDQGPTRKLARGLANIVFSPTELFNTATHINTREGNNSAWTYGILKGALRVVYRVGAGACEVVTFPFPSYKRSYRPHYKLNPPWIHSGYEEFPPELGQPTRFHHVRMDSGWE
jgi:putative exosortase-associated protein (TIGR04073 family)